MKLKKIYKEYSMRPQGPSPANQHHYNKHPKNIKGRQWYSYGKSSEYFPFVHPNDDEDFDTEEGEGSIEGLPENLSLKELFKFTTSANDNTSFHRPPTYGAGAMGAYGKSSDEFGNYSKKEEDDDEKETENSLQIFDDRMDARAKKVQEIIGPEMRNRHSDRGHENMVTFFPWTQGIKNQKHPFVKDMEKLEGKEEIEDYIDGDFEESDVNQIPMKEMFFKENPQFTKHATTAYSRRNQSKKANGVDDDLDFFDNASMENTFLMNPTIEVEKRNKKRKI